MTRARRNAPQLAFEAIAIEGALLSPEWLTRVAQLAASAQSEADYRVPKGLNLRDEIGRFWRIAQAHWADLEASRTTHPQAAAERFVHGLLREVFGFGTLASTAPIELGERAFPIGAVALGGRVPVVVAPAGAGLDTQLPDLGDGGRRRSVFGLAQEYLNAQPGALWGLASDGLRLRLVRDNASLTRPAWVEADLARIFREELYADFAALWLLLHESRFGTPDRPVESCPLEAWREAGREEGTRAREHLRAGVEEALTVLGQGFLSHPENGELRAALHDGSLSTDRFFGELLRLVYRLIFLLTVEERDLLHPRRTPEAIRSLYAAGYGLRRLRDRSARRSAHDRHGDLWEATRVVFRGLATGEPRLGLPALGGLFDLDQCAQLDGARLQNRALLLAVFRLGWLREAAGLSRVNWRDMGPEELGSVYESLLELVPRISQDGRTFSFADAEQGRATARKESGSYYTPDSLVQALLDVSLEPVIRRVLAENPGQPVRALLRLAVVDPACGSGHFLLAAARRIAAHLARVRAQGTPSAEEYRDALREVVGRCIYGVDLNPMAVELCRVALWMEAVVPGQPLSFLRAHIRQGNALVGATPELLAGGVPDDAWEAVEGDDKPTASRLKKENKNWRQERLFGGSAGHAADDLAALSQAAEEAGDESLAAVHAKAKAWEDYERHPAGRQATLLADLWCSAFFWPKVPGEAEQAAPVRRLWEKANADPRALPPATSRIKEELRSRYQFFHWPIAFPHVFARGGFDVVIGNPPWDTLSPDAKEFFARWEPQIRQQTRDEQQETMDALSRNPDIADGWASHRRRLFTWVHFLKNSGRFRMYAPGNLGKGDFNVYRMFVETALSATREGGVAAQVVPDGLYSGANTSAIRQAMFERFTLDPLLGFENAAGVWFPGVHRSQKLCIYAARNAPPDSKAIRARFGIRTHTDLAAAVAGDLLQIPVDMIREFSPDALAVMEFGDQRDIDIAAKMYARWPKFGDEDAGPPYRQFMAEVHMGNDRDLFSEDPAGLPLYEGRMVSHYDHRAKGYRGGRGRAAEWVDLEFGDPGKSIQPQWFIPPANLPAKARERVRRFRLGWCDVTGAANERTLMCAIIPPGVLCGDPVPNLVFDEGFDWAFLFTIAALNSFVVDYLVRKKVSSHVKYTHMDSLPIPRLPLHHPAMAALGTRVLRLTCTGPEMTPFWNAMAPFGWVDPVTPDGPVPGLLDDDARLQVVAEIEVIVARDLYGLSAAEMEHVLSTFPIVARRQREQYGEYRTRELIRTCWTATSGDDGWPSPGSVSVPGATPTATVSDSHMSLAREVVARLREGGSCVMLGPRWSGRTAIAHTIASLEADRTTLLNLTPFAVKGADLPWRTPDGLATMLDPELAGEESPADLILKAWRATDRSMRPIVVFDDAVGLTHVDLTCSPTTFGWLRAAGQESAGILYIASRADWRRIMSVARGEPGSSFGNDVRTYTVPPLTDDRAREFLTNLGLERARHEQALRVGGRWAYWLRAAAGVLARTGEAWPDSEVFAVMLRDAGVQGRTDWMDYSDEALDAVRRIGAKEPVAEWPSRVSTAAREEGIIDEADRAIVKAVNPVLFAWVQANSGMGLDR